MRFPDTITEEQRSEIFWAIDDRRKRLDKLAEDASKAHAPADGFKKLLRLYHSGTMLVAGEPVEVVGLIAMFAPDPELPLETVEGMERKVGDAPDLFGGGAETGGGNPPGKKEKWKGKRGGPPEKIGLAVEGVVGGITPDIAAQREAAKEAEASAEKQREGPVWIETAPGSEQWVRHETIPADVPEGVTIAYQEPKPADAQANVPVWIAPKEGEPFVRHEAMPDLLAAGSIVVWQDPNPTLETDDGTDALAEAARKATPSNRPPASPDYGTKAPPANVPESEL
jgi:hypothetical protein